MNSKERDASDMSTINTSAEPRTYRRAVVIGAGAVGSHLAISLRPRTPLLVIDTDERVRAAFIANGAGAAAPADLRVSSGPRTSFQQGDIAIIATSAARAVSVASTIPAFVPIVCVSNGLNTSLSRDREGGMDFGVVEFAASCPAPGQAVCTRAGWLTMSRHSPAATWLAATLDPARQPARLVTDLDSYQRGKLMLNASLDPVAAVIGGSLGAVFQSRASFRAFRALLSESLDVARASGWRLSSVQGMTPASMRRIFATPLFGSLAAHIAGRQANHVESTLAREIARGDIGELDQLCGAIVRQGESVNIKTPAHQRAIEVLSRLTRQGTLGRPELARELVGGDR